MSVSNSKNISFSEEKQKKNLKTEELKAEKIRRRQKRNSKIIAFGLVFIAVIFFARCCVFNNDKELKLPVNPNQLDDGFDKSQNIIKRIYSETQRNIKKDKTYQIKSIYDIKEAIKNIEIIDNQIIVNPYKLIFDFSPENKLPSCIGLMVDEMKSNSTNKYPVILFRAEENPLDFLEPKIRVNYLSYVELSDIIKSEILNIALLNKTFSFKHKLQQNYWELYSRDNYKRFIEKFEKNYIYK